MPDLTLQSTNQEFADLVLILLGGRKRETEMALGSEMEEETTAVEGGGVKNSSNNISTVAPVVDSAPESPQQSQPDTTSSPPPPKVSDARNSSPTPPTTGSNSSTMSATTLVIHNPAVAPTKPPQALVERLKDFGQEDVFAFWEELTVEERSVLVKDIQVGVLFSLTLPFN